MIYNISIRKYINLINIMDDGLLYYYYFHVEIQISKPDCG